MTNKEHIAKYLEEEKNGNFNEDINPVNWENTIPVTEDYNYVNRKFKDKFKAFMINTFQINPFSFHFNKKVAKTKVIGREHLKGVKGAIVTCNHVNIFDCLTVKYALKNKPIKYCVAEYNNFKGTLGDQMRAQGILPLSKKLAVMRKFNEGVKEHLSKNRRVVIYPEQAMWYMYEKPRPFMDGAFAYAYKFNVPIIPLFITFRNSGKYDNEGLEIKYFTVNIHPPLYPDFSLEKKEAIKKLKDDNYKLCVDTYEKAYGKKLVYDIKAAKKAATKKTTEK